MRWQLFAGDQQITSQLLDDWGCQLLQEEKLCPSTVVTYMSAVQAFARWQGVVVRSRLGIIVPAGTRTGVTIEEYHKILGQIGHGYWRYGTMMGWETGLRLADVAQFRNDQVDRENMCLRLVPQKQRRMGKAVTIPISQQLFDVILDQMDPGSDVVCLPMALKYERDRHKTLSMEFIRLARSVGVDRSFHCLRHGCISRWLNAGASPLMICSATGHSLTQVMRYCHPSIEAQREALK